MRGPGEKDSDIYLAALTKKISTVGVSVSATANPSMR
jgi:hypothetical protein